MAITERTPTSLQASGQLVKHVLGYGRGISRRKAGPHGSLKQAVKEVLAREARNESDRELQLAAHRWLHNKRANTSKPPHRIGRTRGRVKSGGNKGPVKKLDGK